MRHEPTPKLASYSESLVFRFLKGNGGGQQFLYLFSIETSCYRVDGLEDESQLVTQDVARQQRKALRSPDHAVSLMTSNSQKFAEYLVTLPRVEKQTRLVNEDRFVTEIVGQLRNPLHTELIAQALWPSESANAFSRDFLMFERHPKTSGGLAAAAMADNYGIEAIIGTEGFRGHLRRHNALTLKLCELLGEDQGSELLLGALRLKELDERGYKRPKAPE